jgi:hypothetical protein
VTKQTTSAYTEPKRFAFGCYEQARFEIAAKDIRNVDDFGSHVVFGNGFDTVMRVIKPSRRNGKGGVWFLDESTGNGMGEPFNYGDYFPNAHVHPIFREILNGFPFSSKEIK